MTHANITRIETYNTGGNIMVDIIHLEDGSVLTLGQDNVIHWASLEAFHNDTDGTGFLSIMDL